MSIKCPNCGAEMDAQVRFCGACGAPMPQPAAPAPMDVPPAVQNDSQPTGFQPVQPAQSGFQPVPPVVPGGFQPVPPADQPKKKNKKALFIAIGAAAAVIAVCCIFVLPLFGGGSANTQTIAFSQGGKDYYASPYLLKLNGDNAPTVISQSGLSMDKDNTQISNFGGRSIQIGNTIYSVDGNLGPEKALVKRSFSLGDNVAISQWVSPEKVNSCVFAVGDDDRSKSRWTTAVTHLSSDGNYVYFNLSPDVEYKLSQGSILGKVGRISLDGNTIEQVGDLNAQDMAISGGWIYYFDSGYTYNGEKTLGKRDLTRAGIYKAKTDGSSKQLIHAFSITGEQADQYVSPTFEISGGLDIFGSKLYFVDYTAEGEGRLCRMDLNGGGFEYVSASAVSIYTVDTDHNVVYYYVNRDVDALDGYNEYLYDNSPKLCKYDLSSKTETEVPNTGFSGLKLSYYKGYLYFQSYNFMMFNPNKETKVGLRMDVKAEKTQWLMAYQEGTDEWRENPDTGAMEHISEYGERQLYWKDAETR